MSTFFPDLNVWLALTVNGHEHSADAWAWLRGSAACTLLLCRYTQIGLLRLLTTPAVMGNEILTLGQAWSIYDRWLADSRVEFHPEPSGMEQAYRAATAPFSARSVPKLIGDCYLLAHAQGCRATLLTFDEALLSLAAKQGCAAVRPSAAE